MAGKLDYNFLGNSGLKVSNIGLGCLTFGERRDGLVQCNEEESHKMLDRYLEWGGNFIDTANIYVKGKSEEIIGNWLSKQEREKIVLATKCGMKKEDDPNGTGLSRFHIMTQLENSLKKLQTNYVDIYQMHIWDSGAPIEETLSTMNDLVRSGKVRYVGASNVTGWQLQRIVDLCRERGWDKCISLQQQYNLLSRYSEMEVVDVCRNEGIGILPWSPLKGGWLTGKVKQDGHVDSNSRISWTSAKKDREGQAFTSFQQFNNDKTWKILAVMRDIAKNHDKTVAQVALRWLLQKDVVSSVIIGAKTIQQLDDNLGASSGWELTKEEMESLDEASIYEVPYPYEMISRSNIGRNRNKVYI